MALAVTPPRFLTVRILDETRLICEGRFERVYFPGAHGEFEAAQDHAPVLSMLKKGTLVLVKPRDSSSRPPQQRVFQIRRGIAKIERNHVLVVAEL